ncbi:hypothetical protein BH23PSE1_BH23PSE1_11730 [soil metagenome]
MIEAIARRIGEDRDGLKVRGWIHNALGRAVDIEREDISIPGLIGVLKAHAGTPPRVLDFGCGRGPHRGAFETAGFAWEGVDYFESGSVHFRDGLPEGVTGYDGRALPFAGGAWRAVWSWQALEHVHDPERAIAEVARVLAPGGGFCGSTSFLEPFHGHSTFGYTPYGFKLLLERNGLALKGIYPGIDGVSMALRYLLMALGHDPEPGLLAQRRIGRAIDRAAGSRRKSREIQLQLCGHFRFIAERTG